MTSSNAFYDLNPEKVLSAAEQAGFLPTGEFTQLNSYENRVFDLKMEKGENIIAKFYRPHRWSQATILEEHEFLLDLKKEGIPAVAPILQENKSTLALVDGMSVAFFPKVRGRMPQEFLGEDLKQVGRLMAQVHNVGCLKKAHHRPVMDENYHGSWEALDLLQTWIGPEVRERYNAAAEEILNAASDLLDPREFIRIHGDCHRGNLLHNGQQFFLVDFDDFMVGPVMQDFWMLLSGDESSLDSEKELIISGYEELREFPDHQWGLIPILRGLRIISYAAWIARRWQDPSFPRIFPDFNSFTYWAEEAEALEKIAWSL